jgi:hypothetical protein
MYGSSRRCAQQRLHSAMPRGTRPGGSYASSAPCAVALYCCRHEVERRTHPLSRDDFELLSSELEAWRLQQTAAIKAAAAAAAQQQQVGRHACCIDEMSAEAQQTHACCDCSH